MKLINIPALFFFFLFPFLFPQTILAADYYVSVTLGDDLNPGTSPEAPFRTIETGIRVARPGDTVNIMEGIYQEGINLIRSGTAGAYIRITNYKDDKVFMDGQSLRLEAFYGIGVRYIWIEGLEIANYRIEGMYFEDACRHMIIRNNYVHDNGIATPGEGQGIFFVLGSDITIEGNRCIHNAPDNPHGGSGIGLWGASNAVVRNNISNDNRGNGILIEDCTNVLVENNICNGNRGDFGDWFCAGIWVDGGHTVIVRNNWLQGNLGHGIEVSDEHFDDPYGYHVYNNVAVGNYWGIDMWGIGKSGAEPCRISHNTCIDNVAGGFQFENSVSFRNKNTKIYNNIFAQIEIDRPAMKMTSSPTAESDLDYNLYYRGSSSRPILYGFSQKSLPEFQAATGWETHGLSLDPLFAGAGAGHLSAASPCIDAGTDAGVDIDMDGDARPLLAGYDMGADEYSDAPCWDLDGDGYEDTACGGADCDDADPEVNPGAVESIVAGTCTDGIDNDCDGLADTDPECAGSCFVGLVEGAN